MKLQLVEPGGVYYSDIKPFIESENYTKETIEKDHSNWMFDSVDYEQLASCMHDKPICYLGHCVNDNNSPDYIIEYGEITIEGVLFKIADQINYHNGGMHSSSKYVSDGVKLLFENKLLDGHYFVSNVNIHTALMHISKPRREALDRWLNTSGNDIHNYGRNDVYNVPQCIIERLKRWANDGWYENYYDLKTHEIWLKIYHPHLTNRYGFVYPSGSFNKSIDFSIPKATFDDDIINFNWFMPTINRNSLRDDNVPNPVLMVDTKFGNFRYDVYVSLTKEFIQEAGDPLYGLTVKQEPPLQCEIHFALKAPDWFVRMARKYKLNIHF